MTPQWRAGRAVFGLLIAAAAAIFLVLVVAGGPFYQSFDEAKYVGLGRNLMAGRGYTTVFDSLFLTHPPAWPLILAAPETWLRVDPLAVGRLLNALSGAGLIVLAGLLAWRIAPAAGGLAAVAMLGVTYLSDLSRTARLDVPGATVTVLAVLVGTWAMRRDSIGRALAAGALFALAFLVKETSLVYLAVPTLAAIFDGRPPVRLARLSAAIGLTFVIGTAWWFVVVAEGTGLVYRTSLPAWTLVPLGVGLGITLVGGLAAPTLARWAGRRLGRPNAAADGADRGVIEGDAGGTERRHPLSPAAVGIGTTIGWTALLVLLLGRSPELHGAGLIDPTQIRSWLLDWQRTIAFPAAFAASGLILAVGVTLRLRGRSPFQAAPELLPAVIVSLPFLVFVVATGEPPRNDFAPLAFAFALAAGGWGIVVEEVVRRRPTRPGAILAIGLGGAAGAVAGLAAAQVFVLRGAVLAGTAVGIAAAVGFLGLGAAIDRRRPGASYGLAVPAVVAVALVASGLLLAVQVQRRPGSAGTAAGGSAVTTIAAWVRGVVPPSDTLAVGSLLGNETAIELPEYRVVKLGAREATVSTSAPLGLSISPGDAIEDWLAVDPHPRKTGSFFAFDAGSLVQALRSTPVAYWIYVTGQSTAAPTIVGALTPAHGFDVAAHWTFGDERHTLEAWVFRIDPDRLGFADTPIRIAPEALSRLVRLLSANPNGAAVARSLSSRILVDPDDDAGRRALVDLRQLAGP
jgi:4-amino-4-deoxy-L-arabinose transferase-like glycosyltransferase